MPHLTRSRKRLALVVTSHLSVNGLILPTLQGLHDAGWTIHVVCAPGPVEAEVRQFATVEFVPMERSIGPGRDSVSTMRMARLLRRIRPDVLVGGTPKAAMVAMVAGRLARVPVRVFQVRGSRWDGLDGKLRKLLLTADRVTATAATDVLSVSDSLADLMVSSGACKERPVVLGSGGSKGIDPAVFYPGTDYDYAPEAPRLGFVGRLSVDKGIGEALRVFESIRMRTAGASLMAIGELDESQPITTRTMDSLSGDPAIAWERNLSPAVVGDRMRGMDLLIFPSVREGLPNAVIEAAACGVPTVGWDVTGVRDAVVQGQTGFLVPVGDQDALVDAAEAALVPERHRQLREESARFARAEFASEEVQAAFLGYLERLWVESRNRR